MFPKVSITNNFSSDFHTCEALCAEKRFVQCAKIACCSFLSAFFFIFTHWIHSERNNSASAARLLRIALKAYGSLVRALAGQRGDRRTDGCRDREK